MHPERLDPDWARYPNTVLVFDCLDKGAAGAGAGAGLRVDLRAPIAGETRRAFAALGLRGSFAVLTAYDPRGRDLDSIENERRARELDSELRGRGVHFVRVEASSPGGEHCERSVAAALPRAEATTLAARYGQVAIFWFDGRRFWIVDALTDADPIELPSPG